MDRKILKNIKKGVKRDIFNNYGFMLLTISLATAIYTILGIIGGFSIGTSFSIIALGTIFLGFLISAGSVYNYLDFKKTGDTKITMWGIFNLEKGKNNILDYFLLALIQVFYTALFTIALVFIILLLSVVNAGVFALGVIIFIYILLLLVTGIFIGFIVPTVYVVKYNNPNLKTSKVFKNSFNIVLNNFWEYIYLYLSLLLWNILGVCTFYIANLLFINQYINGTIYLYIDELYKKDYEKLDLEDDEVVIESNEVQVFREGNNEYSESNEGSVAKDEDASFKEDNLSDEKLDDAELDIDEKVESDKTDTSEKESLTTEESIVDDLEVEGVKEGKDKTDK